MKKLKIIFIEDQIFFQNKFVSIALLNYYYYFYYYYYYIEEPSAGAAARVDEKPELE